MTPAGQPNGFALIGALWLMVVISAIGLQMGLEARDRRLQVLSRIEETGARETARAGIEHARARLQALLDADPVAGFLPNSPLDPWAEADSILEEPIGALRANYQVSLTNPGARLHLNHATEEELRRLLEALRVDAGRADRIAQSVMDWRDPDDLHHARGAEAEDYVRRRSPVRPRNGPFRDLSELRHVKNVTPEVLERVLPHLTLVGEGRVNLYAAERPVLLALPGMTEEAVAALMRLRRQGRRLSSVADLAAELSPRPQEVFQERLPDLMTRATLETRELEVVSTGRLDNGRPGVTIRGLFVRGGDHVFLVWTRVER
jgi:general secretion pathway protein K